MRRSFWGEPPPPIPCEAKEVASRCYRRYISYADDGKLNYTPTWAVGALSQLRLHRLIQQGGNYDEMQARPETFRQATSEQLREVTPYTKGTVLQFAVQRRGTESIAKIMLERLVQEPDLFDVNATDVEGRTALHFAAWMDRQETAALLLARGANVHLVDLHGATALHIAAASHYHDALIAPLLAAGSDPNVKDIYGRTPAHWLVLHGKGQQLADFIARAPTFDFAQAQLLQYAEQFKPDMVAQVQELAVQQIGRAVVSPAATSVLTVPSPAPEEVVKVEEKPSRRRSIESLLKLPASIPAPPTGQSATVPSHTRSNSGRSVDLFGPSGL